MTCLVILSDNVKCLTSKFKFEIEHKLKHQKISVMNEYDGTKETQREG